MNIRKISGMIAGFALALSVLCGCNALTAGRTMLLSKADATDGKVFGSIKDESAAVVLEKAGLNAEAKWLRDQAQMAQLWNSIPEGTQLNVEYRLKSTKQIIGLNDIERRVWFSGTSDFALPKPDYGQRLQVNIVTPPDPVPEVFVERDVFTPIIVPLALTNPPSIVVTNGISDTNRLNLLDGPPNAEIR